MGQAPGQGLRMAAFRSTLNDRPGANRNSRVAPQRLLCAGGRECDACAWRRTSRTGGFTIRTGSASRPISSTSGPPAAWCSMAFRRRPMTGTSRSRSRSRKLGQDFVGYFAWHYPPPFLFVASLLAQLPYQLAFIGWVVVSLLPFLRRDAGDRRPQLRLSARARGSDGVHQCAGRAERIPHRGADRRHALSDSGTAGAGRHLPRAVDVQAAIRAVVSDRADRSRAVARVLSAPASPRSRWLSLPGSPSAPRAGWRSSTGCRRFSQAFLTEGKATWWKLQSIFSLVRYFGGTEQLAWAFQWVLTAAVAVVLALIWRSRVPYTMKAAALGCRYAADHALSLHVRHDGAGHCRSPSWSASD